MESEQEYAARLQQRTLQLEALQVSLQQRQEKNAQKRTHLQTEFTTQLSSLREQIFALEDELFSLAQRSRKFITAFQHIGMQPQLETLSQRTNMLHFEEWITKKEFKKLV